jgi:hypothetical protein
MKHVRFAATALAGMIVTALSLLYGVPDAFARPLHNQSGGSTPVVNTPGISSGMAGWEVAIVAVAAALFAAGVTVAVVRIRFGPSRRSATT